jgi:MFS family permease
LIYIEKQWENDMEQGSKKESFFTKKYASIMIYELLLRTCQMMQTTLLPLYIIEKGFSTTIAGLTTTAFMLVAVAFRPVSGRLVDSKGRYSTTIIGIAVYFIATGLLTFEIPAPLLLGMRGLQGLGFCLSTTATGTLAADLIPRSRMSEGIGYIGLTQTISQALPPLLALALKDVYGYQVAFTSVFVISGLALLSGLTLRWSKMKPGVSDHDTGYLSEREETSSTSPSGGNRKESAWEKLVDITSLKPSTIMLLIMFASSGAQTFLVAHAINKGIANPGVFFTATAITMAVGRLSVGKISQRFGSIGVVSPGIVLVGLSMIGMYSCANVAILIISGALYGLGLGMVQPELCSLTMLAVPKERRGMANSTLYMAWDLGQALGAYAMGVLAGYAGLGSIFVLATIVAIMTLLIYLLLYRKGLGSPA